MNSRPLPKRLWVGAGVVRKVSALCLLETNSEIITMGFLTHTHTHKILFIPMGLTVTTGLYRNNHCKMAQGISKQIIDKIIPRLGLCWEVGRWDKESSFTLVYRLSTGSL